MLSTFWIFLLFWCLTIHFCLGQWTGDVTITANVNRRVTLQCPSGNRNYSKRVWYRGYFNDSMTPHPEMTLYEQGPTGMVIGEQPRSDVYVEDYIFHMTIGRVQPEDEGDYTCMTIAADTRQKYFDHVKISLSDLNELVEEKSTVILKCPLTNGFSVWRLWLRGYFNGTVLPQENMKLYSQGTSVVFHSYNNRTDMSLDPYSFQLTIGNVQLEDDGFFTCRRFDYFSISNIFYSIKISAYIQPVIIFDGLEKTFRKGDSVIATCRIDRLYPPIEPTAFKMSWGRNIMHAAGTPNSDKSYRYVVQMTKTVSEQDDEATIMCAVTPVYGENASAQQTLNVQYKPIGSPHLTVDNQNPYLEDIVTFICNTGNVRSNPEVSLVMWYKDGQHLTDWPNTGFKHRAKMTINGSGSYDCYLENILGFSSVSNVIQVNVSASYNPFSNTNMSTILPAAVGATTGCVLIIIIIIIFIVLVRRKMNKQRDHGEATTNTLPVGSPYKPTNLYDEIIEGGETDIAGEATTDTPPVGPYEPMDLYEEIIELGETDSSGEAQASTDKHHYEALRGNPKLKELDEWLRKNSMSPKTVELLQRNEIFCMNDLRLLTNEDIIGFGLSVGERNRLKNAIKTLDI